MRLAILLVSLAIFTLGCDAVGGSGKSSGCPDCIGIQEMMKEYEANPIRAEQTYVGNRYNVSGKIDGIREGGFYTAYRVSLDSGNALGFADGEQHDWLLQKSKGDRIDANCLVYRFIPVFGTPQLMQCRAVKKPASGR